MNESIGHRLAAEQTAWKEALVRRMLRHWNPAWGNPTLVEGPSGAKAPQGDSLHILGLIEDAHATASEVALCRVFAIDHVGPDNWPLPTDGPWPLPTDEQWREWNADR